MDFPDLPTGLALFAVAAAAVGVVARQRKRGGVDTHRDDASDAEPPAPVGAAPAHQVAAQAVIENARAGAAAAAKPAVDVPQDETVPAPLSQFDGAAWAPTVPMDGLVAEPQFADTMPADVGFAETLPGPIGFGPTHFADTQVTELVAEERPGAVSGPPPKAPLAKAR